MEALIEEESEEEAEALEPRQPPSPGLGRRLWGAIWDFINTVVPAILLALFVHAFVAQAMVVQGPSMQPTLYYNERVIVEKVSYRLHAPRRGDIIILRLPDEDEPLIKRVVALGGETVAVRGGHVFINGEQLDEPWSTIAGGANYPATPVPEGYVFVLGDNRPRSRDSRSFGPVPLEHVIGHALFVYWPLDQVKGL